MNKIISWIQKYIYIVLLLASMSSLTLADDVADNVVIGEVLYDPIGTESGGEAIELYNPTNQSINISGWTMATESSMTDATLPDSASIAPYSFYLIADIGWSDNKDNASWPNADYEEPITLYNTDSGVALMNGEVIIDAVGWGDVSLDFSEGTSHDGVDSGNSLERKPGLLNATLGNYVDADNNSADFLERVPEPQNTQSMPEQFTVAYNEYNDAENNVTTDTQNITTTAEVTNAYPWIESVRILTDDDHVTPGVQISPVPGANKQVRIEVTASDNNGFEDVALVEATFLSTTIALNKTGNINATTDTFDGRLNVSFYQQPGDYSITASVYDSENVTNTSIAEFEYLSLLAFELDSSSIQFEVQPGQTDEVTGDIDIGTLSAPTLRNIGNTELDMHVSGTDLVSGEEAIDISNMEFSFDNDFESLLAGIMSTAMHSVNLSLVPGISSLQLFSLRLYAPIGVSMTDYYGSLSLIAVSS